jgi:hypothetical protein
MSQVRPCASLCGLAGPRRVGDQRTAERDQRRLAAGDNTVRFRRVGDAAECHQRHAVQMVPQFPDEMHVGHRRAVPIGRVHFEGSRVRSAGEANIIDVALAGQKIGYHAGFGGADAARHSVIAWQLPRLSGKVFAMRSARH